MKRWVFAALALTLVIGAAGCNGIETFKVVFSNRLPAGHSMDCYVNGTLLGTVPNGGTGEFSVDTRRLDGVASPDSPHAADVVFTARDLATGALSQAIPRTIYTDRTEYVDISAGLF